MRITPIPDNDAPKPLAFYSPGAVVGDVVYLADQIASDYVTGVPPEARRSPDSRAGSDIREQVEYVLGNLRTVAQAAGTDLALTVLPPRTTSQTGSAGSLDPVALVSIDAVAVLP